MRALLLLVAWTSIAGAADVGMTASTRGSNVVLTFENKTDRKIHMPIRVRSNETMWDWLTVKLTRDGATRTIAFIHDRDKSFYEFVDLAPGAKVDEPIDLAAWTFSDGDPLAPGTYSLEATWDTLAMSDGPKVKLTATATLAIAAPVDSGCTGKGTADVTLLARGVANTGVVEIGLHSTGTSTLCVASRVAAGEIAGRLADDRRRRARDPCRRRPHEGRQHPHASAAPRARSVYTRYDVAAWAARKRNAVTLPHKAV